MSDDIMNFDLPVEKSSIIKVLGIGGGAIMQLITCLKRVLVM